MKLSFHVQAGRRTASGPPSRKDVQAALLLVGLFALPFAAGGAWSIGSAFVRAGEGRTMDAFVLGAVGLPFLLVGGGLLAAMLAGRGKALSAVDVAAQHPAEPWRWRPDWAAGYVEDGARKQAWGVAAFALLWNLIAFPIAGVALAQGVAHGNRAAWIALVFPVAGVWLAAWASARAVRAKRDGVSRFEIDTVPVPVGRSLTGSIRTHLREAPAGGFTLTLSALRLETRGTGDDRSTWTHVLWQETAQVEGHLSGTPDGVAVVVPVAIRVPLAAPGTDTSDGDNETVWRLEVTAPMNGPDFRAAFDAPIFTTAESRMPETAKDASYLAVVEPTEELAHAARPEPHTPVVVRDLPDGVEMVFGAARNPGMASGLSGFTLLWWGTVVGLVFLRAPFFFPLVFGLFGLLLTWISVELWARVTVVRANAEGMTIATGLFRPGEEKRVRASDVARARLGIGMQSGTTPYYDIVLDRVSGGTVKAGTAVNGKREAEWIAARLLAAMGKSSKPAEPAAPRTTVLQRVAPPREA